MGPCLIGKRYISLESISDDLKSLVDTLENIRVALVSFLDALESVHDALKSVADMRENVQDAIHLDGLDHDHLVLLGIG